jgi:hypothetical protein
MSDIDKIMKVNEMSANLKKHGFAASADEASGQAQEVFKEKIADVEKKGDAEMADDKDVARIERNFETFKSATHQQLEAVRGDLQAVMAKMNEMIKVINELEKLKDSVTTIDEGEEKQTRLAPKVVKKPKEDKPKTNPRSGDMKPGDIDLSETFYYGTR